MANFIAIRVIGLICWSSGHGIDVGTAKEVLKTFLENRPKQSVGVEGRGTVKESGRETDGRRSRERAHDRATT